MFFFLATCTLSGARGFYLDDTNTYSKQSVIWMRLKDNDDYNGFDKYGMGKKGKDARLMVVKGLNDTAGDSNGFQKSKEQWNQPGNSRETEKLFAHMGFSWIEAADIAVPAVYRQENPQGIVCFSQSMVYNGNDQQAPAKNGKGGAPQPTVGWDTLNWTGGTVEYPYDRDLKSAPKINVNWQAKLTPVTSKKLALTGAMTVINPKVFDRLIGVPEALYLTNH